MGTGSPLGKRLTVTGPNHQGMAETKTYTVIGVMKDFHQSSLRQTIEPMVFTWEGDQLPWINLRINPVGIAETIQFLEKTWKSFVTEFPFTFDVLDDKIDAFYKQDRRTRSILGVFTILALFTACLGLVGLASFVAERRTKEIGIRKVLGASTRGLVLMQSREFLAWVLAANAVAWPAAYIAAGRWLHGFAYRVRPGPRRRFWPPRSRLSSPSCASPIRPSGRQRPIRGFSPLRVVFLVSGPAADSKEQRTTGFIHI